MLDGVLGVSGCVRRLRSGEAVHRSQRMSKGGSRERQRFNKKVVEPTGPYQVG